MILTALVLPGSPLVAPASAQAMGPDSPAAGQQQSDTDLQACYVPGSGTIYRIGAEGLATSCVAPGHVAFSWNAQAPSGPSQAPPWAGLEHAELLNLVADDHPQYVLADGMRTSTNGFAVTGTLGSGAIPEEGPGVRLMWYPGKAAFRAGIVTGDRWDDGNIGQYSMALGRSTRASGSSSTALGTGTVASGSISTAMGEVTTTSGVHSTAMGFQSIASGSGSTAMGRSSKAEGFASLATGIATVASGDHSTALGNRASAGGESATAMGFQTTASGVRTTAMGSHTTASGDRSTAIGFATTASANQSTALGGSTTASGVGSTAMGSHTTASGSGSTAMGSSTTASGHNSTAMGSFASTDGKSGAFVYGDRSIFSPVNAPADNSFTVRAAGGFNLYTSSNLTTGCDLPAGSGTWTCTSTRDSKTDFEDVEAAALLDRLAAMDIQSWTYRNDPAGTRHLGPTAEDFWAAYGLGTDNRTIGMQDLAGVALVAIQALAQRTSELRAEQGHVGELEARVDAHEARIERLEALVERLVDGMSPASASAGPGAGR